MDSSTAPAGTTITTQANSHLPPPKAELRAPIPISFSNGSATSPHLRKNQPQHVYRECLRNHAASLGGHTLDGCGEFMPSSPTSPLSCAACGCHRNFHRRLPVSPSPPPSPSPSPSSSSGDDPVPPSSAPRVLMALRSSGAPPPRKRFRTRFSPEQKERMQELSDRLGWRLQKRDDRLVEDCCRQIGVGKGVFKVWMHNNKHALAPRPHPHPPSDDAAA